MSIECEVNVGHQRECVLLPCPHIQISGSQGITPFSEKNTRPTLQVGGFRINLEIGCMKLFSAAYACESQMS